MFSSFGSFLTPGVGGVPGLSNTSSASNTSVNILGSGGSTADLNNLLLITGGARTNGGFTSQFAPVQQPQIISRREPTPVWLYAVLIIGGVYLLKRGGHI